MKNLLFICAIGLAMSSFAQQEKAEVFKLEGVNLFAKSLPESEYEEVEEIKASGMLKSSRTHAELIGAAGYNKFTYALEQMNDLKLKAQKKGKTLEYDGAILNGNKVLFIKLESGAPGSGFGNNGATSIAQREKKTQKLIFYASKPMADYKVVSEITYNQGGLGETMRGGNTMDVAINGMLDKGKRWVKRGKIDSDFDALIVDWRMLRMGKVRGELIKFK